jgi:hypothetical protein
VIRRFRIVAAALVVGALGLAAPAAHAAGAKVKKGDTVFCAYADNPWAPAAACLDNPLPNRLPLPW